MPELTERNPGFDNQGRELPEGFVKRAIKPVAEHKPKPEKTGWLRLETGSVNHHYAELEGGGRESLCGRQDDPSKLLADADADECKRCRKGLDDE